MRVGVPKELKDNEYRVAITPAGVRELVVGDHDVLIEQGAGVGSSITDAEFERAGATIVPDADTVFAESDMVLKVKEPDPRGVPPPARRPDPVHLPPPRRQRVGHEGPDGLGDHRYRLRDRRGPR